MGTGVSDIGFMMKEYGKRMGVPKLLKSDKVVKQVFSEVITKDRTRKRESVGPTGWPVVCGTFTGRKSINK